MYNWMVELGAALLQGYVDLMMDHPWVFVCLHLLLALVFAMKIG